MTLLDNTITSKTSSSHYCPLKLQIQIAKYEVKIQLKIKNKKLELKI